MKTNLFALALSLTLTPSAFACFGSSGHDLRADGSIVLGADQVFVKADRISIPAALGTNFRAEGATPNATDYGVKVIAQDRDEGGILSTTYEISPSSPLARYTQSRLKVTSNYLGRGVRAKGGCGEVIDVTQESQKPAEPSQSIIGADQEHQSAPQRNRQRSKKEMSELSQQLLGVDATQH